MSNIERAIQIWIEALNQILRMLFRTPQTWDADVYATIKGIHSGLAIIASALTVMFFLYGFVRQTTKLQDLKHPEIYFSQFLRFVAVVGFVPVSMTFMERAFEIVQKILSTIMRAMPQDNLFRMSVPQEISQALEDTSVISVSLNGVDFTGLKVALMGFISMIVIFVCAIILLVITWGRFINLYIHMAVSGIFFAALGSEQTQTIAISFIRSFINACFRAVIIALALIIYSKLITSDASKAIAAVNDGDVTGGLMTYMKDFLVGALVTISICKSGDAIASKWGL